MVSLNCTHEAIVILTIPPILLYGAKVFHYWDLKEGRVRLGEELNHMRLVGGRYLLLTHYVLATAGVSGFVKIVRQAQSSWLGGPTGYHSEMVCSPLCPGM